MSASASASASHYIRNLSTSAGLYNMLKPGFSQSSRLSFIASFPALFKFSTSFRKMYSDPSAPKGRPRFGRGLTSSGGFIIAVVFRFRKPREICISKMGGALSGYLYIQYYRVAHYRIGGRIIGVPLYNLHMNKSQKPSNNLRSSVMTFVLR